MLDNSIKNLGLGVRQENMLIRNNIYNYSDLVIMICEDRFNASYLKYFRERDIVFVKALVEAREDESFDSERCRLAFNLDVAEKFSIRFSDYQ